MKATRQQVQEIVDIAANAPLGQLAFMNRASHKADNGEQGDCLIVRGSNIEVSPRDFPQTLAIVRSSMIFVDKQGISEKGQNRIRRLAAFGNPEFYRAQAMHQSVYGKPRIIWCGEENAEYIMLPRACEQKLAELANQCGVGCAFDDRRNAPSTIKAVFTGNLRERQRQAAEDLLRYEYGVLSAPTGFGKTVIGAYLIGELKVRTLVIVPKTSLIDQWKTKLLQFLAIDDDRPSLLTKSGKPSKKKRPIIGQIGGGKNAVSGIVDVATFQSLTTKDDTGFPYAKPFVSDYDLVICDECQYAAAPQLELVMKSVKAKYVYGLSATPKRSDGLEGIIHLQLGPVRHKVSPKEQAAEQGIRRILLPRFSRVRLPLLEPKSSFNQVVDALCEHDVRNALIVDDVVDAVGSGRTPLVITQRKEHAVNLGKRLEKAGIKVHVLIGEGTGREKRERIARVQTEEGSNYAIVATGSYLGEGFDLPQLDALMLASPYSWEGVITQYSGRLHREREGKSDVVVYDYVDSSIPMLERMYKRRLKAYAKLGYEIDSELQVQGPGARIVTASEWRADFRSDMLAVCESAVISAPYASSKLVESILPDVASVIARGIDIYVILKRAKSKASSMLQVGIVERLSGAGCDVRVVDTPLTGIAIFDNKVSWYGTLPLLAFAKTDDCSLRVDSAEISADLREALDAVSSKSAEMP